MSKTVFVPGGDERSMVIARGFGALVEKVWQAWTTQEMLERWWAPKPWKAVTKDFHFEEGGRWLYAMTGPTGEEHWAVEEYVQINPQQSFVANDYFCDKEGKPTPKTPRNQWTVEFAELKGQTKVKVTMVCKTPEDLTKMTEMGFKEGFSQALDQLACLVQGK